MVENTRVPATVRETQDQRVASDVRAESRGQGLAENVTDGLKQQGPSLLIRHILSGCL